MSTAALLPIGIGERVSSLEAMLMLRHLIESGQFAELDAETAKLLIVQWYGTYAHGRDTDSIGLRRLAKLSGLAVGTVRSRREKLHQAGLCVRQTRQRVHKSTGKSFRERTVYRLPVPPEVRARANQIRTAAVAKEKLCAPPQRVLPIAVPAPPPELQEPPVPPQRVVPMAPPAPPLEVQKRAAAEPSQRRRRRWEPPPEQAAEVRRALDDPAFTRAGAVTDEVVRRAAAEGHLLEIADSCVGYVVSAALGRISRRWNRRPPPDFHQWPYLYSSIRNELLPPEPGEPQKQQRGLSEPQMSEISDGAPSTDPEMSALIAHLAKTKSLDAPRRRKGPPPSAR